MTDNAHGAMYRQIAPHQHHRVAYAELFFDLVFVFAVTQISHTLLAHFTPLGVLQVTLLFLAVWWVWGADCGLPSPTPRCRSARQSSSGSRRRHRARWRG